MRILTEDLPNVPESLDLEDPEKRLKWPFQPGLARSAEIDFPAFPPSLSFPILVCDPKGQVRGEPLRPRCCGNWPCCHWTLPQGFGMNTQNTRSQKHSRTHWTGSSVAFTHSSGRSLCREADGKQPYLPRKRTHSSPDVSGDTPSWRSVWPEEGLRNQTHDITSFSSMS